MRHSVLVSKCLCPVLLMELLSCLHCLETSFDRCKPQLYTEVLLLSWEFFLTQILPVSKKQGSYMGKQAICAVHHTGAGKVSFHQLPQYSTSHKPVSRKSNFLARATSPRLIREQSCFAVANLWLSWVFCSNSSISHLPNLALLI